MLFRDYEANKLPKTAISFIPPFSVRSHSLEAENEKLSK
jgi:hypothetical protein